MEMGFDGAYTVIEVNDRLVVAGVVPWEPMESSLEGASFSGDMTPELFALDDGRPAAYGEGTDGRWDDLLVEVGPTEALSISAERATRRELVGIAEHVVTDGDRAVAPVIDDPPSDRRVLGSVGVDTAIALRAQTYPSSNVVPGPVPGYGIGWVYTGVNTHEGPSASLSVVVLPGDDADLSALEVAPRRSWGEMPPLEEVDLNGRPGVLIGSAEQFGGELRYLVTNDASCALVVVTAYGPRMPADDELVTIAESVRPVDPAEWEQTEIAAFGGPDLSPDAGESEIARGQADDVEWLLQTRTYKMPPGATGATGPDTIGPIGPTSVVVDECLKLSTRKRACASPSLGGGVGSLYVRSGSQTDFDEVDFPAFLLITSPQDRAELVRFTVDDTTVEGPMHRVPGGTWDTDRAAVQITDVPEGQPISVCNPDPPPMQPSEGLSVARVDLYNAAGTHLGCGGM